MKSSSAFQQVTRAPHPEDKTISAIHCENEARWQGELVVLKHEGDAVAAFIPLPGDYLENAGHYIRSFHWRKLREPGWVLVVFTSTHRGNGSLWVFEIKDGRLRTLMNTKAVADNDECWFDHGQLQIEQLDGDISRPVALRLHGTEHRVNEFGQKSERKVDEHWVWNGKLRVFTRQAEKEPRK